MAAYTPVPFTQVRLADAFWAPRLRQNHTATLPIAYAQLRDTGRLDALRLTWQTGQTPAPHKFWDSDVAKWVEAASYAYAAAPDPALKRQLDEAVALIAGAQQADGYLNTYFTNVAPDRRWTNLRDDHELYCAGHLIEAGVAHCQATGERALLEVVARYADHIAAQFGPAPGQRRGYCGHEELELALVKLYRVTGEQRYLALSQYLVDERGQPPHYFDLEAEARGEDPAAFWAARGLPPERRYSYMQAHRPVREQTAVTGHAVRAMYLYAAMADLAGESGDPGLLAAGDRLWRHLTERHLYLTGGLGPSARNEGFTHDYDLPNLTAYAETCAAIGLVFWSHRLLQHQCDRTYADVMERALYNGVLSGVSLDGARFFYENPLASLGDHHRQPWFDCACCPPNVARLLASLGGYAYATTAEALAVHLYVAGQGQMQVGATAVTVRQTTHYPWEGAVTLHLETARPTRFTLRLRWPGWCPSLTVTVNGLPQTALMLERGYVCLTRHWQSGDEINLTLAMPVTRMYARPEVRENLGQVALQRGPVVYCLEQADHTAPIGQLALPRGAALSAHWAPEVLDGVMVVRGEARVAEAPAEASLYAGAPPRWAPAALTAVPYCRWDNRAPGPMRVWLPEVE